MLNKDLLKQLNTLKDIKPDSKWKDENRGVLMNQIYGAQEVGETHEFKLFNSFMKTLPKFALDLAGQPAMVVVFILVFVFGGSAVSVRYAHNTKPGDSLYIAKIVSERTKEALTFNDKEKAQLVIKHAKNRAEELNQVLSETNYSNDEAEKLVDDFQKEIQKAKIRLEKINTDIAQNTDTGNGELLIAEGGDTTTETEDEIQEVFSVNSGKDENGMQVTSTEDVKDGAVTEIQEQPEVIILETTMEDATPSDILEEAGELLDDGNYDATLDKLVEANEAIEKSIAKEDSIAPASTTVEIIEEDTASTTLEN